MPALPFTLRRPVVLLHGLVARRDRPDLERLAAIPEPDRFVWEILPHAARTFAPCIALLPAGAAPAAAVAYLYCRILDTLEDLIGDAAAREAALRGFAARFAPSGRADPPPAGPFPPMTARDDRDRAHVLLVERVDLVDRAYAALGPEAREVIGDLVRDMAEGMIVFSRAFAAQDGVLVTDEQVAGYCRAVIGHPVVFTLRLLSRLRTGRDASPALVETAMRVSEFIQLANVTRDIEKDLERGVAYRAELAADLRGAGGPGRTERVRRARRDLLALALRRAPEWRNLVRGMDLAPVSVARASTLLMLLYTHRYYGRCAARAGFPAWSGGRTSAALILGVLPAALSRRYAEARLSRAERDFRRVLAAVEAERATGAGVTTVGRAPA